MDDSWPSNQTIIPLPRGGSKSGSKRFCSDTMETHTFSQQALSFGSLCCTQESGTRSGLFVFFLFYLLLWFQQTFCCVIETGGKQGKLKQSKAKSFKLAKQKVLIMDLNPWKQNSYSMSFQAEQVSEQSVAFSWKWSIYI